MTSPRKPARPRWLRPIGLVLLVGVLILAFAGFVYENISETRDQRFNPMLGKRVNISATDQPPLYMHIDCVGEGTPAVVLDSGLGDTYLSWSKVQPEIAKFARVCSYDRAGIGFSDSSPRPRTSQVMAEELNALLHAAGVMPPFILVGHSMGGYDVRVYAHLYASDVVGMVLVDASHPDQDNRLPAELKNRVGSWIREYEFLEYSQPSRITTASAARKERVSLTAAPLRAWSRYEKHGLLWYTTMTRCFAAV